MVCKLVQYNGYGKREWSCYEGTEVLENWKREFKLVNKCTDEDKVYLSMCKEINQVLVRCTCNSVKLKP